MGGNHPQMPLENQPSSSSPNGLFPGRECGRKEGRKEYGIRRRGAPSREIGRGGLSEIVNLRRKGAVVGEGFIIPGNPRWQKPKRNLASSLSRSATPSLPPSLPRRRIRIACVPGVIKRPTQPWLRYATHPRAAHS